MNLIVIIISKLTLKTIMNTLLYFCLHKKNYSDNIGAPTLLATLTCSENEKAWFCCSLMNGRPFPLPPLSLSQHMADLIVHKGIVYTCSCCLFYFDTGDEDVGNYGVI